MAVFFISGKKSFFLLHIHQAKTPEKTASTTIGMTTARMIGSLLSGIRQGVIAILLE